MEFLMHIPTPLLLQQFSFDEICDRFKKNTGQSASGVVYNVFSAVGPNFPSDLYRSSVNPDDSGKRDTLTGVRDACRERGLSFWLCFDTTMPFAASNATHTVDSQGDSARHSCIHAPGARRVLRLLAEEAKRVLGKAAGGADIAGIVLPAQDLWPMSAGNNVIEVSCFCRYCSDFYRANGLDSLEDFAFCSGPLNLALRDTGTGIDHIHVFTSTTSVERLIEYSRAEGMLAAEWLQGLEVHQRPDEHPRWNALREKADQLLRFVTLREQLTLTSLEAIGASLREVFPSSRVACIVEGLDYEWTGGYFLDRFATANWFDEVWIPPSAANRLTHREKRLYCVQRAYYVAGEFTRYLETLLASGLQGTTASEDTQPLDAQTRRIGKMLQAFVMANPGDYLALDDNTPGVVGGVAPVFFKETVDKLLERLPPAKGMAEQLLELMRTARSQSSDE